MSSPVEFMEIQPQPSRNVLQETLQEEEVQFKILKIIIRFSKRTRVALLKSLDNTSQTKLREVHLDLMKDLWETSQKLWPLFQPQVSLALQFSEEVKLLIFLRWSRASQNTATKRLVLKWAKRLAMEKSHLMEDLASKTYTSVLESIKVARAKRACRRRYSSRKMVNKKRVLGPHLNCNKRQPLLSDKAYDSEKLKMYKTRKGNSLIVLRLNKVID